MIRAASIILALALFAGCTTPAPDVSHPPLGITRWDKSCLPAAISMSQGLTGYGIESRVIVLVFLGGEGHAICLYRYKGKIWAYDNERGSVRVHGNWLAWDDLARAWTARWAPSKTLTAIHWL
jgi:hypothetical protein